MNNKKLTAAFAMAFHSKDRVKVVEDNISPTYFTDEEYSALLAEIKNNLPGNLLPWRAGEAVMKMMNRTAVGEVLAQTAFTEHSLKTAVLLDAKQYISLNAGYDSFACRQPAWATRLQMFEINPLHIAMDKQARLTRAEIATPENVNYIYADVFRPGWEKLLTNHPSFAGNFISFVSLGNIPRQADRQRFTHMLELLAGILPSGSSMVFSYNESDYGGSVGDTFPGCEMEILLGSRGFLVYELLTPQQVEQTFFTQFNYANIRTPLKPPDGVNYVLAVKKEHRLML